jgi:hypothetical protein
MLRQFGVGRGIEVEIEVEVEVKVEVEVERQGRAYGRREAEPITSTEEE